MQATYYATPAVRCNVLGKVFRDSEEARQFAQRAADGSRVVFTVWSVLAGRPTRLAAYVPNVSKEQAR